MGRTFSKDLGDYYPFALLSFPGTGKEVLVNLMHWDAKECVTSVNCAEKFIFGRDERWQSMRTGMTGVEE